MTDPVRPTYRPELRVDLGALRANYRAVKAVVGPAVTAGAVVKANAYGIGTEAAVRALAAEGCRTFFTAFSAEAAAVRAAAPHADIFVLSPFVPDDGPLLVAERLVPCLYDRASADAWIAANRDSPGAGDALPSAALHFETGINRLALPALPNPSSDIDASLAQTLTQVRPRLIMSHLACADEPQNAMNAEQLKRFRSVAARYPGVAASLCNSGGVFLGPDYHFDVVRPGVCLFGHDPSRDLDGGPGDWPDDDGSARVRPVMSLRACLAQVKNVAAGEGIGYGATFRSPRAMRIGVVLAGYADGLPRSVSTGTDEPGLILDLGGYPVPVVGRVSMDMVMVDLGRVPEALARVGAEVELFGAAVPIERVARAAGTIPYEVMTGIGARVRRLYDAAG